MNKVPFIVKADLAVVFAICWLVKSILHIFQEEHP